VPPLSYGAVHSNKILADDSTTLLTLVGIDGNTPGLIYYAVDETETKPIELSALIFKVYSTPAYKCCKRY